MKSRIIHSLFAVVVWATVGYGQGSQHVPVLFQQSHSLELKLRFAMKDVRKSRSDTVFFPATLTFRNAGKLWDSIPAHVRARGNFRRSHCYFPPLRLKIKKSLATSTPFEGSKSLKIVLPCHAGKSGNTLIAKEYLCYKLLEPVTPYFFHTRLADILLIDQSGKQSTTDPMTAFLIEDDDLIAERFGGKVVEETVLPQQLNDTAAVIHDFFQYLIANTDWSTTGQHNAKVIQLPGNKKVPLAYDFDMAGLVNAPYATVNEELGIRNVQERVYRGYCRSEPVFQYVRSVYLQQESAIMQVMENHQGYFSKGEYIQMKDFVVHFFTLLKNDHQFRDAILLGCRTW